VTLLEYQAYSKLAIVTMENIIKAALNKNRDNPTKRIVRCAVEHRLGVVPVGKPSIIIAVSAPHRREAFVTCEQILEEVKAKAQIWKREYYQGEPEEAAQWKANAPS
jgi:molybdopterin synthase catalytic subunit